MKDKIFSFIIACTLIFSCVAIPFIAHPVPAFSAAEGMLSWEYMMHLWSLEGLFTHESANYYGGFQGYSDEQKSNAMSGLKNFFDDQTSDLHNYLLYHELIAESKVKEWWDNLKSGTLDLVGDVGSSVYDWLNSKSKEVAKQWDVSSSDNYLNSAGFISGSYVMQCMKIYGRVDDRNFPFTNESFVYVQFREVAGRVEFSGIEASDHNIKSIEVGQRTGPISFVIFLKDDLFDWSYGGLGFGSVLSPDDSSLISAVSTVPVYKDKTDVKDKYKMPLTEEDLENQKQLPVVIDTYGGNLPKPYRDPNNDDDGDGKSKPVPYVPQPIHIDWPKIHGDGDGSGGVKIIIKDTDINSTKQFNYNEYKELQVQIKKLSQTLNKILNLKQYNIQNNKEIDGDGKTLPIMVPDFHQAIDLKKKFPFSLPWDVLYIFKLFNSTPEAPAVTIDYPVISKGSGWGGYTVTTKPIVVDFNTDIWNQVAKVCRVMLFLLFAVGVCWAFFVK